MSGFCHHVSCGCLTSDKPGSDHEIGLQDGGQGGWFRVY